MVQLTQVSLVGEQSDDSNGSITNSYATGNVSGSNSTGGLVGKGRTITNSYASGSVIGR